MSPIDALYMRDADIQSACHAWEMGGCLALSLWLGRYKPHFSVKDYGALVQLVREELNDDTDYGKEPSHVPS